MILHAFEILYVLLYCVCGGWFAWAVGSRQDGLTPLVPLFYAAAGTFWLTLAWFAAFLITGHVNLEFQW